MRLFFTLVVAAGLAGCMAAPSSPAPTTSLASIEAETGGRLGVSVVGPDGKSLLAYRGDERFATCSTFKTLLAAMVLDGVQQGELSLDQEMPFTRADLVSYSPYVEKFADAGAVSVGGAAGAAVMLSDNSAANLLYGLVGGPGTLFQWLRTNGDTITWPSRLEPDLNENRLGDRRDTTSPAAMAQTVRRLLTGDRLNAQSRAMLEGWLRASETGKARIRAGLPGEWIVGDKTGTCGGDNPSYNDVAVVRSGAQAGPYIISVYLDRPSVESAAADAAIAKVAALAAGRIEQAR